MKPLRILQIIIIALVALTAVDQAAAQRRITPVEPPTTRPDAPKKPEVNPEEDRSRLQEQRDAEGNIIFIDTISGKEWVDTTAVRKKTRMIYPKIYNVAVGLNIWDAAMRIFGQDYGLASVWGELNMHNRYFPTVEIGLGSAKIKPDDMNYTYRSGLSPYFKIGASYNVFYNSNPRYKFLVGLRYGLTNFSYKVTDVTLTDGYWNTETTFDIPSQRSTVGYFEFLAGVRVGITGNFSLGWDVRFHSIVHESSPRYGKPMYIPGLGKRGAALSGSISLSYTFGLNSPATPEVNNTTVSSSTNPTEQK